MSISLASGVIRKAVILVAFTAALIAFFWIKGCQEDRQKAAAAKVERGQAGAARKSAEDAIATQGNVSAAAGETERTGDENERIIRAAPGADQTLDRGLNRAARSGMCKYAVNRNKPECRVQQPHTP